MLIDRRDRLVEFESIISRVIKCESCFKCCKNSSAFVLSHEVKELLELNVPMHVMKGVHFITPNPDGRCPKLNEHNKCDIYENRPIACRIFPFYLMDRRDYQKQWVLFHFCPDDNCLLPKSKGRPSPSLLRLMAHDLEKLFSVDDIKEMIDADDAIAKRDRLEVGFKAFQKVITVQKCLA